MKSGGSEGYGRFLRVMVFGAGSIVSSIILANCAGPSGKISSRHDMGSGTQAALPGEPGEGGYYHLGKPYAVAGRTYIPALDPNYSVIGLASWYGSEFQGRHTANGEIFDENIISAAHPTLPLPSYVRVTNLDNDRSLLVRVNDRGPFAHNRIIDLSRKAAQILGFSGQGITRVKVDYVGRAPLRGSKDHKFVEALPGRMQADNNGDTGQSDTSLMSPASAYATPSSEAGTNILTSGRGLY
jgi:peptidoglycan lytic transglycosylase